MPASAACRPRHSRRAAARIAVYGKAFRIKGHGKPELRKVVSHPKHCADYAAFLSDKGRPSSRTRAERQQLGSRGMAYYTELAKTTMREESVWNVSGKKILTTC